MTKTATQLQQVWIDNFVAYFRSHVAHINITGRTFESDHALLAGIYEARQAEIDTIGEIIRTVEEMVPNQLQTICEDTLLSVDPVEGSADTLLEQVREALTILRDDFVSLNEIASDEAQDHIANYAQEQISALNKNLWMLDSTLA